MITASSLNNLLCLANLPARPKLDKLLLNQLNQTLLHLNKINQLPLTDLLSTYQVSDQKNVTRLDAVISSLPIEITMAQAPKSKQNYYMVNSILQYEP